LRNPGGGKNATIPYTYYRLSVIDVIFATNDVMIARKRDGGGFNVSPGEFNVEPGGWNANPAGSTLHPARSSLHPAG